MRKNLFWPLAVAVVLFGGCTIVNAIPEFTETTPLNLTGWRGTHNSYHLYPKVVWFEEWNYCHRPLYQQAKYEGIRQFEIDLHLNGGDFDVYHLNLILRDDRRSCATLTECLQQLKVWSHEMGEEHHPVFIWLEDKQNGAFESFATTLDAVIVNVLGSQVFKPNDLLTGCSYSTVHECVYNHGWPTLQQMRGKFIFGIIKSGIVSDEDSDGFTYYRDTHFPTHPTTASAFLDARDEDDGGVWPPSWAAFAKPNSLPDPGHYLDQGIIVGTKWCDADSDPRCNVNLATTSANAGVQMLFIDDWVDGYRAEWTGIYSYEPQSAGTYPEIFEDDPVLLAHSIDLCLEQYTLSSCGQAPDCDPMNENYLNCPLECSGFCVEETDPTCDMGENSIICPSHCSACADHVCNDCETCEVIDGAPVCVVQPDGASCGGTNDVCIDGVCENPCLSHTCDGPCDTGVCEVIGIVPQCVVQPDGASCGGTTDVCIDGVCENPCLSHTCDRPCQTGVCEVVGIDPQCVLEPDGAPCGDGSECLNGECLPISTCTSDGDRCDDGNPLTPDGYCSVGQCLPCLIEKKTSCIAYECCSQQCSPNGRSCQKYTCAFADEPCGTYPCCEGLSCTDGTCLEPSCAGPMEACNTEACCAGLECIDSTCCISMGGSCAGFSDGCCGNTVCGTADICCLAAGATGCNLDTDCCATDRCDAGTCGACRESGEPCPTDGLCCDGLQCVDGFCNEQVPCIGKNKLCDPLDDDCCPPLECDALRLRCK